jgi:tetratricopeptide (TPR) repeat protein
VPGYLGLARHWELRERHDLAIHYYDECIKLAPKDAGLLQEAGMCQARHKEWEAALARLYTAVQLDPENRDCAMNFALCLARAERFDESLAWLRKLQNEAEAQYTLARMLHHLGRYDLCMERVRLSLNADPMFMPAQELLASLTSPVPATPVASAPPASVGGSADWAPQPVMPPAPVAPATVAAPAPMAAPPASVTPPAPPPAEPPPPDENLVHPVGAETAAPPAPAAPTPTETPTADADPAAKPLQ